MNGFVKKILVAVAMAGGIGSVGCNGGDHYRNLVDPCWPERYNAMARQSIVTSFTPQVQNGQILDQTIWNYHFEPGTDTLTPGGYAKLDQLVRRRPEPDPRVFIATARDLSYNPEKSEDYADGRRDLDSKRAVAIQKYLVAQTSGRPMTFDVLIHDPSDPGMSAVSARNSILSQRFNYTGILGTAGGGSGQNAVGSQGGGQGQQGLGGQQGGQGGQQGGQGGAGGGTGASPR